MPTEITTKFDGHEFMDEIYATEGERQIMILANWLDRGRKIEFTYHTIKEWRPPFQLDPLMEEDRARLAAAISDHYTARGCQVVIDRRRFCPRCHDLVDGSERDDWPGGECTFCGKQLDRLGRIIA